MSSTPVTAASPAFTARQAPRLLPAGLQLAAAAGAVALVAAAWLGAGEASAQALAGLDSARPVVYVTLPPVTVTGHREAAPAAVACATGQGATL